MAWNLTVSGDVQAARGSAAHAVEERLLADLNAVLSKPEYGVLTSFLRGNHVVTTAVHVPVIPDPEPEVEPEPAPEKLQPAKPGAGRPTKGS